MNANEFVSKLKTADAKGYLVGGAVRDKLLGKEPKDNDYCVTGISQQQFEDLFPESELQGKDFPVYRMEIDGEVCEVALARKERKIGAGHKGFEMFSSPELKIEDDLARRDISINAMAIDLETQEIIDPFGGKEDLENGVIRKTTDAFKEDPLRVYRAARFAARFEFKIEPETTNMMNELKEELPSLSYERVIEETKKAMLTETPSEYFRNLKKANVLDVHFPEVDALSDFEQSPEHHPEGDVFEHTMQVVDSARFFAKKMPMVESENIEKRNDREMKVVMAALLHDVGKQVTKGIHPKKGTFTYRMHEVKGVPMAEKVLDRFNLQKWKKSVLFGVAQHMKMHKDIGVMKPSKVVDFVEGKFEKTEEGYIREDGLRKAGIDEYTALCAADVAGRLSERENLPEVLKVFEASFSGELKSDGINRSLSTILANEEEVQKLSSEIKTVTKHKEMIEMFASESADIQIPNSKSLMDIYQGQELGYKLHQIKKEKRIKIFNKVKKQVLSAENDKEQGLEI